MAVIVVGSINADVMARVAAHPRPGETVLGAGGDLSPGGKGANQAVAAARAGAATTMIGLVGDDALAEVALSGLRAAGVDIGGVRIVGGATGLALIAVADSGENTIVVVPGASAHAGDPELAALAAAVAPGDVVLCQGELPADFLGLAISRAHERGARVVLNLAPVVDVPSAGLGLVDVLIVNEHEARDLLQRHGAGEGPTEPAQALAALRALGPAAVVMSLGARGAVALTGDGVCREAPPPVTVVDTTGAGDALVGSLCAGLAAGDAMADALRAGVAAGSAACEALGAQPIG